MTREEVVNSMSLQDAIQVLKDTNCYGTMDIAKTVILKALEQEPCTDAISRQAVLEVIRKCHCEEWVKADIGAPIEALSPVTPAEKVGHWIKIDDCSNSGYYCSECHKRVVKEGWSDTVKKIKYCPNCGAKMGGEQNV
jgi:DNA-directed RNA polymerase subunit RPC12/RpoP